MGKKFKLLLLTLGALTLFSACSSVYTDTEMKARGVVMFLSKTMGPTSFEKRWQTTNKAAIVENFKKLTWRSSLRSNSKSNKRCQRKKYRSILERYKSWKIVHRISKNIKKDYCIVKFSI